ncbi:MAG: metalloregulator ArsR/SmtB family transcription factor [Planctomycetes bacterium]|nr:metalloregulator ArsR/SmtB family transcription factor [Planctomycetota bacterium]
MARPGGAKRGGGGPKRAPSGGPSRSCVEKLKSLADATRLEVLHLLAEGAKSVSGLQERLRIDQSLLSHHLAVLREAGLVRGRRAGKSVVYRLAEGVAVEGASTGIDLGCCQLHFVKPLARALLLLLSLLFTLPLAACGGDGAATRKLTLSGSSTMAPACAELGKAFTAHHPDVRVEVQAGGSSRGVADAQAGLVDLGMASRALKPEERAAGLFGSTLALDGICLIVHRDNPVTALSADQVVAIYRGAVRRWSDVGGIAAPITVVNKADGRSTLELFLAHFKLQAEAVRADVVIGDNAHGIKTVAGNRAAIGYVSIGSAELELQHGTAIRMVALDGVAASRDAVRAGRFPLQRPLTLVTRGEPAGLAAEFIRFTRSPEGAALLEAQAFVPLLHAE